jgi:hypothetical protein
MKEQLESLNSVTINFGEGGMAIVNIILAFVMFGVALNIKPRTVKDVFKKPKSIIVGAFLQWFALPAITFAVVFALNPFITPMIALGMILVASCPGGNISNFLSSLSKGNIVLSVSLTAITTSMAPIITPINFFVWGSLYSHFISIKSDIPMLVIPFVSDQPVNARQVEKLGLGKVLDYKTITADALRDAAFAVMEDQQIQENLRKIQEEIANAPGNTGAVRIIEDVKHMR